MYKNGIPGKIFCKEQTQARGAEKKRNMHTKQIFANFIFFITTSFRPELVLLILRDAEGRKSGKPVCLWLSAWVTCDQSDGLALP